MTWLTWLTLLTWLTRLTWLTCLTGRRGLTMTATTSGASGRRRGRPPKADAGDTKELLLQAALALFAEKGFEGTSVRDIARSVGLSESVLYAHFDSKRAI